MPYKLSGKQIREIRNLVSHGVSIKQIAEEYKVSESLVRSYTKAEMKIRTQIKRLKNVI